MTNYVADQLATLHTALEGAGWTHASPGVWCLNDWTLRTQYVWGEATLSLSSKHQAWQSNPRRYYRGAQPVEWAKTRADKVLRKIFEQGLDNQTESE